MTAERTACAPFDVLYYLDDYCDEVVPCDCSLEAWADWLSKPDPDWSRLSAAKVGDTFLATVATVHEIECVRGIARWGWPGAPEAKCMAEGGSFYLRHGSGQGWAADNSGETVAEALEWAFDPVTGDRAYIAAMVIGERVEVTFGLDDDGPVLTVRQVGHA